MKQYLQDNRRALLVFGALIVILLIGGAFRLQHLDWDQGQYFHPDERAIIYDYSSLGGVQYLNTVAVNGSFRADRKPVSFPPGGLSFFFPNDAINLRPATEAETKAYNDAKALGNSYKLPANVVAPDQPVPDKAINFWNASFSPLNPRFFAYGSFPMYLIKFASWAASGVAGPQWSDYEHLFLVGRFLSVLFSLGTIVLVFGIGRRAFSHVLGRNAGDAIGLVAAAFLSVSVLDIQLAHFLTFDVALTFFVTLTVFFALGHVRNGTRWSAVRMGVGFGLALACKVSALPLVLVIVAATLIYGLYGSAENSGEYAGKPRLKAWDDERERFGEVGLGPRLFFRTFLNLVIAGFTTLAIWFVAMPYAFLDFNTWLDRVLAENGMARGLLDYPYTRQYVGTTPFLYQFGNLIQWGLGIPLGVLAVCGLVFSFYRIGRFRLKTEILFVCWLVPYMLVTFTGEAKFDRYLLPILPLTLVLAARLLVEFYLKALNFVLAQRAESGEEPVITRRLHFSGLRLVTIVAGVFIFGWALVWALSFSSIYSGDHTRVAASKWFYDNVPAGASISAESWDENVPFDLPGQGKTRGFYRTVQWNSYDDLPNDQMAETWAKRLADTDYIVLSSNRLYATIPKLPWRYPVTTQLYDLLFKGDLGYTLVKEFSSYPTVPLFGWKISDDTADESFSVYDHPKVLIFKKTQPLSEVEYRNIFAPALNAPWIVKRAPDKNDLPKLDAKANDGVLQSTGMAQRTDVGKSLLLDKPVDQQPAINDNGWNSLANDQEWLGVIVWFLMAQGLGLIGLPIAMRVFRRLPDRGYILAKPIGAAFVALVIFLVVGTRYFMNTVATAYMCLLLTAAFSLYLWWRYRADLISFYRHNRRLILLEEAVFAFGFVLFVLIRLGNPDLWHPFFGGEKPMEFAHLNAIVRSAYFPPYDPWFSDGYLNYYYYGQYLVATWVKLTGIETAIAFNLAIPLLYAFVLTGGYCISYNLAYMYKTWKLRREGLIDEQGEPTERAAIVSPNSSVISKAGAMWAGLFGAFLLAVAANIDGLTQLFQHNSSFAKFVNDLKIYPVPAEVLHQYDYFRSTRVIPDTINEFPYFSFLYADLHAHLIALPFTLVLLALALNLISVKWVGYNDSGYNPIIRVVKRLWHALDGTLLIPLTIAVVVGLIGATNIWDLPTYLLVIFMALFMAFFRRPPTPADSEEEAEATTPAFRPLVLLGELVLAGLTTGAIVIGAFTLYNNFFSKYQALYSEVKLTNLYTDMGQLVYFWLVPLFFVVSYLLWNYWRWLGARRGRDGDNPEGDEDGDISEIPDYEYEEELDEPAIPQRATLAINPRQNRPELAFSMAGVTGDSGGDSGFGGSSGGNNSRPRGPGWYVNGYSLPWVVVLAFAAVIMVTLWFMQFSTECYPYSALCNYTGQGSTYTGTRWASFATMAFLAVAFLFLIFGRAYDPDPAQSAEARNPVNLFVKLMLLAALCIIAGLEVVYLADDFANSYRERANSIFKFYYQAWTMMALSSGFIGYVLWTNWVAPRWSDITRRAGLLRQSARLVWVGIATLLVLSASLYALLTTPVRISERMSDPLPAPTLDGRAYLDTLHRVTGMPNMPLGKSFDMAYEAKSMHEFYDKVQGTPVVLQASIWPYRGNGSWIAVNTGLPIVLGYDHHVSQQHYDYQVAQRSTDGGGRGNIHEIYNTPDIETALGLLNYYHVTYVHLGIIERDSEVFRGCNPGEPGDTSRGRTPVCYEPLMSEAGFAKFDKMVSMGLLEISYQNPGVTILKVTAKGRSGIVDPNAAAAAATGNVSTDPKLGRLLDQVKRNPDNFQAHYDLGQYYLKRNDLQKAIDEFKEVVRIVPNEVNPYHVLGDAYAAMGQTDLALAAWKEPTLRAPNVAAAHNKYAIGLVAVQRYDEAIKEFNLTLQLSPQFVEAAYHLGEMYEKMGNTAEAIKSYERTMSNAPNSTDFWSARAAERLRILKK